MVWRYTDTFKHEIELGLDIGIRTGSSASQIARDLKQYLKFPDKLFRRVRNEHGMLKLSQAAKAFHPGRGVYRSSYKNALRLAATETNMAYRTADHDRWQELDFVVGQEIHLSGNHTCLGPDGYPHPFHDICDELQGKYPKDFKFTGWHPNCRCFSVPVLKSDEEVKEDMQRILRGEDTDTDSVNAVDELPDNFKSWIKDNSERIARAKSQPYFIRDNQEAVNRVMEDNKEGAFSKFMPDELKPNSEYLNGENYVFDKQFFDLLDPKKPITLEILKSDSGSWSSGVGDKVHIASMTRGKNSQWETKAVIYHEYGHCIDAQRTLWLDQKLIDMRNAQIKMMKKRKEYIVLEQKWNYKEGGWYYERVKKQMSMVEYVDMKLKDLVNKIWSMDDKTFITRGITKHDVIEQIGSTRDTIKSLVPKYGFGHSTKYFNKPRMKETEYLAHAFENAFLGNRIFQKYLPDIYSEMVNYTKALKPL